MVEGNNELEERCEEITQNTAQSIKKVGHLKEIKSEKVVQCF